MAARAAAQGFKSAFAGVCRKDNGWWAAAISHDGKKHHLGSFDDDQQAARVYDEAARRLRPKGEAHGSGAQLHRLNFPTGKEEANAQQKLLKAHTCMAGTRAVNKGG